MSEKASRAAVMELDSGTDIAEFPSPASDDTPAQRKPAQRKSAQVTTSPLLWSLSMLWDQRQKLTAIALLGAAATVVIVFLIPARFQATAKLLAAPENVPFLVGILNSKTLQDRLIARFHLKKVYGIELDEEVRGKLAQLTTVDEDPGLGIITITITDSSARRAASLCNAYGEELNSFLAQLRAESAQQAQIFLEQRANAAIRDLDADVTERNNFAGKNLLIDPEEQNQTSMQEQIRLREELIAGSSEVQALKGIYASRNPRIKAASAQIQRLQDGIARGKGSIAGLRKPGEHPVLPSARELPMLAAMDADFVRDAYIKENYYAALTLAVEAAKIEERRETPNAVVLEAAIAPETAAYPPRILILCLGDLLSAGVAIAWGLKSAPRKQRRSALPLPAYNV